MKYTKEVKINLSRKKVISLFDNPDNLVKWQKGLVSFETFSGKPGQPGAKSKLKYKMGKREIEMVETIVKRNLPDEFSGTYEAKNVWNLVENYFEEVDKNTTNWRLETEFLCKGYMRVMVFLMPGMFKKQTLQTMLDFKAFAES